MHSPHQIVHRHAERIGELVKRCDRALLPPGLDRGHGDAVHAGALGQGRLGEAAQGNYRYVLAEYLADRGIVRRSWGINPERDAEELLPRPDTREWAVVSMTSRRRATVVSASDRHHDRLWDEPRNPATRKQRRMEDGRYQSIKK